MLLVIHAGDAVDEPGAGLGRRAVVLGLALDQQIRPAGGLRAAMPSTQVPSADELLLSPRISKFRPSSVF